MECKRFNVSRDLVFISVFTAVIAFLGYGISTDSAHKEIYIICLVISVITSISLSGYISVVRQKENDRVFRHFSSLLKSNGYFNSALWRHNYNRFCQKHPLHSLSSSSMERDISFRYIVRSIKKNIGICSVGFAVIALCFSLPESFSLSKDLYPFISFLFGSDTAVYLDNFFKSGFNATITSFLIVFIIIWLLYLTVIYLYSIRIFERWLKKHPHYIAEKDRIKHSYLNGYAFECSYFCAVIGPEYVHAFDGTDFHTVSRKNISSVKWLIEKYQVYYQSPRSKSGSVLCYAGDEYRFNIRFTCKGTDTKDFFYITLDQFQGKMIMDNFFPDISEDTDPEICCSDIRSDSLAPISGCTSSLILK